MTVTCNLQGLYFFVVQTAGKPDEALDFCGLEVIGQSLPIVVDVVASGGTIEDGGNGNGNNYNNEGANN